MNRQISFLQRINFTPKFPVEPIVEVPQVDRKDKYEELLDAIYSVDPRTGVPRGDLAVFMSKDANPEIRDFIQQNLLMDMSKEDGSLSLPDSVRNAFRRDVTDDDIAALSRNHDESADEYAKRLSDRVHDMKMNYQRERETRRLRNALKQKKDA